MAQLFKNDARARVATAVGSGDTSIVLEAGYGDLFPVATMGTGTVGDWFRATLEKDTGEKEIVKVRTRASGSDIFSNVLRAQEGTTAMAFDAGSVIGLRLTAADVEASFAAAMGLEAHALLNKTRPIQDWDAVLAAASGYPQYAMVVHGGFTWRSKVNSNTATPGTDETKWERLGFSESERIFGAPTLCAATGPDGSADKSKLYISTGYGEVWQWLGDGWRVVAKRYGVVIPHTAGLTAAAENLTTTYSITAHRAGRVQVSASIYGWGTTAPSNQFVGISTPDGARTWSDGGINYSAPNALHACASATIEVTAGALIPVKYAGTSGRTDVVMSIGWQYVD